jgi:hypothetical protein
MSVWIACTAIPPEVIRADVSGIIGTRYAIYTYKEPTIVSTSSAHSRVLFETLFPRTEKIRNQGVYFRCLIADI